MDPMESTSIIIIVLKITGYPTDTSMLHTFQTDLSIFTSNQFDSLFQSPQFHMAFSPFSLCPICYIQTSSKSSSILSSNIYLLPHSLSLLVFPAPLFQESCVVPGLDPGQSPLTGLSAFGSASFSPSSIYFSLGGFSTTKTRGST